MRKSKGFIGMTSANFRRGLVGLSFLLLAATPALAEAPWQGGKKYALIVGINDYQNESVADLQYAGSDANLLKATLLKEGFESDDIFLLTSGSAGESSEPSLTNIVFRLEWLRDVVGPGDTLVFYFAGHGVSMDSETFLLTEEADQRSKGTLMISSLRGSTLNELLKSAGAQNTLVLLDACRNDPTSGRGDKANTLSPALSRGLVFKPLPAPAAGLERNTATIFACSEGQRSWEWGDKKQGFFTYFLSEALKTGAYDKDGNATLQSLVAYLRDNVSKVALRETNNDQVPMMRYEGPGPERWVIARSTVAPAPDEKIALQERAQLVARAEAAELDARKSKDKALAAEAVSGVALAEKEVATRKLALSEIAKSGGDLEKAKLEVEFAEDNLRLAKESVGANDQRLASTERSHSEAVLRLETSKLAEEVTVFGSQGESSKLKELEAKLSELEGKLTLLIKEKRSAVERALVAERQLAMLENQLDAKWEGRALGKRPTRRTRREDLWRVVDPGAEEAESL